MTWRAMAMVVAVGAGAASCKTGAPDRGDDAGPRAVAPPVRERAVLGDIAVRFDPPASPLPEEALARRMGDVLTASGAFVASQAAVPTGMTGVPASVRVAIGHQVVAPGPGRRRSLLVAIEAEIDWLAGAIRLEARENVLIDRPLASADPASIHRALVDVAGPAIEEAARGLAAKETLRQGEDAAVLAALKVGEGDLAVWALELVAERRLAVAYDRAVRLLESADAGVTSAALRALVALRDPRAVPILARRADFADPETMRTLLEAVTAIGGADAVEFLELVASGHADPDMRARATEGLERLGRRTARP